MNRPNLTPPRPVSLEARAVGTRVNQWQPGPPDSSGGHALRNTGIALALLVLGGVFIAAPYRSAGKLGDALAAGDVEQLEAAIDFAALREDLKQQTAAAIDAESIAVGSDGASAGLALAGAAFANATIDAMVRPEMLAKLKELPVDAVTRARLQRAAQRARLSYDGPMAFSIRMVVADVTEAPIKVTLSRAGLLSWKVTGVTMPKDLSKLTELGQGGGQEPMTPKLDGIARVD